MQKQRLGFVDALRGIAILLVIGAHAGVVTGLVGLAGGLANLGGYGVQLFFVVSAFTIFLTLERARARETFSIRNFFIRRLFRIVPVYWMGILLYSALYHLQSRGWTAAPFAWHFPLHILLINSLVPSAQSSVVPGGWSISCEVLFYITGSTLVFPHSQRARSHYLHGAVDRGGVGVDPRPVRNEHSMVGWLT